MEARGVSSIDRFVANPRGAWVLFAGGWVACAFLTVLAAALPSSGASGQVSLLLLLVGAPIPVFAAFLLVPHAVGRLRDLGRNAPWIVGLAAYVDLAALFALLQWVRVGYVLGGPFLLFAWPSFLLHEMGCTVDLWNCLRAN